MIKKKFFTTRMLSLTRRQKTVAYIHPGTAAIFVIPVLILIVILSLFPALVNVAMSFTNYDGVVSKIEFVGLENYINFFKIYGDKTVPALGITFKYMAYVVLPLQFISLGVALLIQREIRGRNFFRALFFMPTILGTAVVASSWKLMYDPIDGPLAKLLMQFSNDSAFLGGENALGWVSVIALWANFGYSMVIYIAGLTGIDETYYEAAKIDGVTRWQSFKYITFPLLWPVTVICLWIALNGTLHMADLIILTTKGQFGTKTFSYYIYESVIENQVHQGQSAATAMYFTILTTSVMLLFNKLAKRKDI